MYRLSVMGLVMLTAAGCLSQPFFPPPGPLEETVLSGRGRDKVVLVDLSGMLTTAKPSGVLAQLTHRPSLPARFREELTRAADDDDVKAVVLRINTPGGTVTASDIVYHEILEFKKKRTIPVIAAIMDLGTSGGYYVAMGADRIVAHPSSVTGSLGVIMLTLNASGLMEKIGIRANAVTSGPHKDMGSPFRTMTVQDREIFQGVIDSFYERFLRVVERGRPALTPETIRTLADGRIYSAEQAKDHGLIDAIGYLDEAVALAKRQANVEDARVVIYRPGRRLPPESVRAMVRGADGGGVGPAHTGRRVADDALRGRHAGIFLSLAAIGTMNTHRTGRMTSPRMRHAEPMSGARFVCGWLAMLGGLLMLAGCVTAPGTARSQIIVISEEKELALGAEAFRGVLQQARLNTDPELNEMVHRVGRRIASVVDKPEYHWEFVVIDDENMVNAFALPGGKVAIYTGILKHTKDEAGLAAVMAHEVAHVLQRHGVERMSRGILDKIAEVGAIAAAATGVVDPQLALGAMSAYGVSVTLPHSRRQESEADYIGLQLMAKAGYDPQETVNFWERMSGCPRQMIGKFCFRSNAAVPEFLSTHPSDVMRIRNIENWLPEVMQHYRPDADDETEGDTLPPLAPPPPPALPPEPALN